MSVRSTFNHSFSIFNEAGKVLSLLCFFVDIPNVTLDILNMRCLLSKKLWLMSFCTADGWLLLRYCGGLVDWCGDDCGGCDSNLVFSEVPRLIDLDLDF